jgi:adenylate cyclase class 2
VTSGPKASGSSRQEIEIKLPCEDLARVRERLRSLGAQSVSDLHFEANELFDDPPGRLSRSGSTLRVRRAGGETILTYKGPARFEEGIKQRVERETRVSDAEEIKAILEALGLSPRFRYEKRREEWRLDSALVALDETPIGNYIEIEADPAEIRRVVVALDLDFGSAIPYSYAKLYEMRRKEEPGLPEDMVFAEAGNRESGAGNRRE